MIHTREHLSADSRKITDPDATADGEQEAPRSLNGNGGLNGRESLNAEQPHVGYLGDGQGRPRQEDTSSLRIAREFDAAAWEIRAAIIQIRTRLLGSVHRELQRAAQDVLGGPVTIQGDGMDWVPPALSATPHLTPVEQGHEVEPEQTIPPQGSSEPEDGFVAAGLVGLLEQVSGLSPDSCEEPDPSPLPLDGEVYEGTVRLSVNVNGCLRELVRFVDELCQKPQCRLLRLVGNHRDGLELWLGLREPLCLKGVLQHIKGVSQVFEVPKNGSKSTEPRIEVWLTDAPSREQG